MSNHAGKAPVGVIAILFAAVLAVVGIHSSLGRAFTLIEERPRLFVTDGTTLAVTAYSVANNGDVSPLAPAPTGLASPEWVAVDASGNTYVTNEAGTITIYAAGSNGDTAPIAVIGGPSTGLISPQGIALDSSKNIYVTDNSAASVFVYSAGSNGNVAPVATISGGNTDLIYPEGIALDSSGNIYVVDNDASSVFVYSALSPSCTSANPCSISGSPIATISGGTTGLEGPYGIALDSSKNIYVTDNNAESVFVYPALGGSGWVPGSPATYTVAPTATISGGNTGLWNPEGIALDFSNNVYVGNYGPCTVTVYSAGSTGNAAPIATISGNNTDLANPRGVALDSGGNIYAVDSGRGNSVTIYPPLGSAGWVAGSPATYSVAPKAAISTVLTTGLINPQGIAQDSSGNIYVADKDVPGVFVYPAGSNGNAAPIATISGGSTGLNTPQGIALDSGGNIYLADEGDVGCDGTASVFVYSALGGATGPLNESPTAAISGNSTGLCRPVGIALDSSADIYVADGGSASVLVYSTGSSGDAAPIATISGGSTGLTCPVGITLDSSGNIYVTDGCAESVFVYSALSPSCTSANPCSISGSPIATISGGTTGLEGPYGIALDPGGYIHVVDNDAISVFVYPPLSPSCTSASPCTISGSPTETIGGPLTELYDPLFIAIQPGIQVLPYGIVFAESIVLNSGTTPTPPRLVKATNLTTRPITIGQVAASPSQFWIPTSGNSLYYDTCSGKTLEPGASCTVGVNFTASPAPGLTEQTWYGTLMVPSNASIIPKVTTLKGVGIAGLIDLSPAIAFPNTVVGKQSAAVKTATLKNPNAVAMTVDSVTASGDFGVTTGTGTNPCNLSGSTILGPKGSTGPTPPSDSCTVGVTFRPTAQGVRPGSLQIVSNARNSPGTIKLQGKGTPPH